MRFLAMRGIERFGVAILALAAASTSAMAFQVPAPDTPYPTPHQREAANTQPQPWAMTYGDEAARRLGMQNGRWEAFSANSSDSRFSLKGGINGQGAVLRLTW